MACAPSEDSDQPGHPPSLISLHCPHENLGFAVLDLPSNAAMYFTWQGYSGIPIAAIANFARIICPG